MYAYTEPYAIKEVIRVSTLVDTAQNIDIKLKKFLISNTGAQPMYFKEKYIDSVDATAANGFLIPAGTVFPLLLTAETLSVVSNATGTTAAILILDM